MLQVSEHPWLLRARLDDVIGNAVSQYDPIRVRPFTFLAQKTELVKAAAASAKVTHPLLDGFKVTPRFALNAKIYEPSNGTLGLGLFIMVGMHHEIELQLSDLKEAGIDLADMYVVRRKPDPGQRRLAGRIEKVTGALVDLSEATDTKTLPVETIKLEGSKENVARCLSGLLGAGPTKRL